MLLFSRQTENTFLTPVQQSKNSVSYIHSKHSIERMTDFVTPVQQSKTCITYVQSKK